MSICYQKANLEPYLTASGSATRGGNEQNNDEGKVTSKINEIANKDGMTEDFPINQNGIVSSAKSLFTSASNPYFHRSSSSTSSSSPTFTSTSNGTIKKRHVQDEAMITSSAKHPRFADHDNSAPPPRTIDLNSVQSNFINDTMEKIRQDENLKKGLLMGRVKKTEHQHLNKRLNKSMALMNCEHLGDGRLNHVSQGMMNEHFANSSNKEDSNASSLKSISSDASSSSNANSESFEVNGTGSHGRACDSHARRHNNHEMNISEELNFHSEVAQIVATPGGLIMYWNEAFFNLSRKSSTKNKTSEKFCTTAPAPPTTSTPESPTMSSLTIFDLIEPKSLPNLYGMLALALHDIGIIEVEALPSLASTSTSVDSTANKSTDDHSIYSHPGTKKQKRKPSHLSITLPCKKLPQSKNPHNISIIFMDDLAPMKRCFLGIITSVVSHFTTSPIKAPKTSYVSMEQVQHDNEKKCTTAYPEYCQLNVPSTSAKNNRLISRKDQATSLGSGNSSLKKETDIEPLPCGRIVRVDDETLCEFLLGSK
mmetsp:Transcript_29172/g.60532  ORF Transcript_29172/g.60532 Transcript_29172/m.60532 type:complete len:538 (+) Transcript_29172:81-1694(+)